MTQSSAQKSAVPVSSQHCDSRLLSKSRGRINPARELQGNKRAKKLVIHSKNFLHFYWISVKHPNCNNSSIARHRC